jgi:hypothetical protein
MFSALWLKKAFFRKLFKMIRKHGISLVLQGLIEFAKTDEKDPKMFVLATDLTKALHRYKSAGGE